MAIYGIRWSRSPYTASENAPFNALNSRLTGGGGPLLDHLIRPRQ
jgi:hypothetical protein